MVRSLYSAALLLAISGSSWAQNEHLKPMEWIIGTWAGETEFQGMKYKDEYVYEWTLNKNFIKHTYKAWRKGKLFWTDSGMMGWDARRKKLVSVTFGMDGSIGWGEEGFKKGETWSWEGNVTGPEPIEKYRALFRRVDHDTFVSEVQIKKGDKFVTYSKGTYRRKKAKKEGQ